MTCDDVTTEWNGYTFEGLVWTEDREAQVTDSYFDILDSDTEAIEEAGGLLRAAVSAAKLSARYVALYSPDADARLDFMREPRTARMIARDFQDDVEEALVVELEMDPRKWRARTLDQYDG